MAGHHSYGVKETVGRHANSQVPRRRVGPIRSLRLARLKRSISWRLSRRRGPSRSCQGSRCFILAARRRMPAQNSTPGALPWRTPKIRPPSRSSHTPKDAARTVATLPCVVPRSGQFACILDAASRPAARDHAGDPLASGGKLFCITRAARRASARPCSPHRASGA
jgi:hypothetical protein